MDSRRRVGALIADYSLFRAVVGAGLEPFLFSHSPTHLMRRSRYFAGGAVVADPEVAPEQFVDDLVRAGEWFVHPPPLFFTQDAVLRLVSRHRDRLRERYLFLMPPHATIEALTRADFVLKYDLMRQVIPTFILQTYLRPGGRRLHLQLPRLPR